MQQQGPGLGGIDNTSGAGAGGGTQSQYGGELTPPPTITFTEQNLAVEAASPISSRPPATANLEELMRLSSAATVDEAGGSGGNRWPRQETLALLKIRSDMDAVFRDATIKGPLWEDISRKMTELGYKKRSGKKCKEKFENVHKYYKRTKEGRGARQDGKTYKFFTELEALHNTTPPPPSTPAIGPPPPQQQQTLDVAPVSVGVPMPISQQVLFHPPPPAAVSIPAAAPPPPPPAVHMSFSSDTNSASDGISSDYDDMDDEDEMASGSRKRKRDSNSSSSGKMIEFFESLMKQVMQKQEKMQKMFLEAIEKREQDRMIREEAWKRQEAARIQREHDLIAQDRALSSSRDAAILSFIQNFTGQSIQLPGAHATPPPPPPPPQVVVTTAPQPPPQVVVTAPQPPVAPPARSQRQSQIHQQYVQQQPQQQPPQPPHASSQIVVAEPEQQIQPGEDIGSGSNEAASSSRWPKAEVITLIELRSGLENRYQEAGPKGPLWEEISTLMLGRGYRRNAKRCKEKWENINKYYKKVKESSKKRPEDSKTCPYFHQLDALYQRKIIGTTTTTSGGPHTSIQPPMMIMPPSSQQHQENVNLNQQPPSSMDNINVQQSSDQIKNNFGEGTTTTTANKPEAIVKELIMGQQQQQQGMEHMRSVLMDDDEENEDMDSYDIDKDEEDEEDDELEGNNNNNNNNNKMGNYKIEYQRPNTSTSNTGPNSFLAMVQ